MNLRRLCALTLYAIVQLVAARPAAAQATTTPGEFSIEPPTLVSLGFDWKIAGDDNRNARVDLSLIPTNGLLLFLVIAAALVVLVSGLVALLPELRKRVLPPLSRATATSAVISMPDFVPSMN